MSVRSRSFPAMGTWIEMFSDANNRPRSSCRSLQWERGLKCKFINLFFLMVSSFPAMGTWIEIFSSLSVTSCTLSSFPAMGTWIEMLEMQCRATTHMRRSLQWERGLKYTMQTTIIKAWMSFPAMGTWIEMLPRIHKILMGIGRSLQWERGLKFFRSIFDRLDIPVVPCNGNVD